MARYWDPILQDWTDEVVQHETPAQQAAREAREAAEDARRATQAAATARDPILNEPPLPGVTPAPGDSTNGDSQPPDFEGGPTPADGTANPNDYASIWRQKGYVDENDMVTLPWLGPQHKMKLSDAVEKFYPDRPPTANDIPPWVQIQWDTAYGVPAQYVNQVPADLRNLFQTMLDATRSAGYQPPAVGTMASNPNYRTA